MTTQYGHKLNPYRKVRNALGVKGIRQSVVITNNPSTIDQNQLLTVRFPNLGTDDVIVPDTTRLAFNIELVSEGSDEDANRTIVHNLGRAIVKKISVKIEGNEIYSLDDADVYHCYSDLWLPKQRLINMAYQGICNENTLKLRMNAGDKDTSTNDGKDKAIADAYKTRFYIPLEFELLTNHMPYYQAGLNDRLSYELTFNDYGRVIKSTDTGASYKISGISLEYEILTNAELARMIRNQYQNKLAVLYDRVLRHRRIVFNKSDTTWNINLNTPAKSMKGILMLFEDPSGSVNYGRDTSKFYNPKINKVTITIEGIPNQLYAQGMQRYQHWDEIVKHFADSKLEHSIGIVKELNLCNVTLSDYLKDKYALWLDMRSSDDNKNHGSGRRIENGSEGITIQLEKDAETAGTLNCYIYVVMDAQLNIKNGRFSSAPY